MKLNDYLNPKNSLVLFELGKKLDFFINLYNLNGQLAGVYEPNTDNYTIKNEHLANNINFVELFYRNQRAVFKLFKSN